MVIAIKVQTGRTQDMVRKLSQNIPKAGARGLYNLARHGVRVLKEEAKRAGIKHWGGGKRQLFSSQLRAKKMSKNTWSIFMPVHGIYLDSMKPHFVAFKKGRLITKWAQDKGFDTKNMPGITIKPHPFIASSLNRVRMKAQRTVQKEINKEVRRKGRT